LEFAKHKNYLKLCGKVVFHPGAIPIRMSEPEVRVVGRREATKWWRKFKNNKV